MSRFLLDSNVLSEGNRERPNAGVLTKLAQHQAAAAIPAPTWYELVRGVEAVKPGARRASLDAFLARLGAAKIPILAYDGRAAEIHARAEAQLAKHGVLLSIVDAQIAAIAVANELVLITRNRRHFEHFPGLQFDDWFD